MCHPLFCRHARALTVMPAQAGMTVFTVRPHIYHHIDHHIGGLLLPCPTPSASTPFLTRFLLLLSSSLLLHSFHLPKQTWLVAGHTGPEWT